MKQKQPADVLCKNVLLKIYQSSQENAGTRVSFIFKKEILTQVFKNIFFTEQLWTTCFWCKLEISLQLIKYHNCGTTALAIAFFSSF